MKGKKASGSILSKSKCPKSLDRPGPMYNRDTKERLFVTKKLSLAFETACKLGILEPWVTISLILPTLGNLGDPWETFGKVNFHIG